MSVALAALPAAAQVRAAAVEAQAVRPVPAAPTLAPSLSAPSLVAPTLTVPGGSPLPTPSVLPPARAAQAPAAVLAAPAAPAAAALPERAQPAAAPTPLKSESASPLEAVAGRAAPEAEGEAPKAAEAQAAEAARLFDNAWVDASAAANLIGFEPSGAPGELLSDRSKRDWSTTVRVVGRPLVVKRFTTLSRHNDSRRAAQNELLARLFVADPAFAPVFAGAFAMPRAVAYQKESWNPFAARKTIVAMEAVPGKPLGAFPLSDARAWVPRRLYGPLFALTRALGLGDMNPGGLLVDDAGRYTLLDTEQGRYEVRPNPALYVPLDMPWVVNEALNEPADYAPAVTAFRAAFAKAEADGSLLALLQKAGLTRSEAKRDLELIKGNVSRFDEVLAADLLVANRTFLKGAKEWGLGDAQARALSDLNRALLALEGGLAERRALAMRDAAREALSRAGELTHRNYVLGPREWGALLRSETARVHLAALHADESAHLPKRDGARALLAALTQ